MDGISLAATLGAGIAPTFTFFFGRLSSLLDRRISSRPIEEAETVESASVLDGDLAPLRVRPEALQRREKDLLEIAGELGAYDRNPSLLRADDERLIERLGQLREILEEVYEQRFTLRGEQRGRTGSRVVQEADRVSGYMVGAQGEHARDADIRQKARTIEDGAWMIGVYTDEMRTGRQE